MKEHFEELIKTTVKPLLEEYGYSKKSLNFYKRRDDLIFVFNFQNSRGNSYLETSFFVNCGIHSTLIDKVIGKTELLEPKEFECYFRQRISSLTNPTSDGYIITKDTDLPLLTLSISNDLKTVLYLFEKIISTSDLVNLMIERNGLNNYKELFEYLLLTNDERLKVFVKEFHRIFGTDNRWSRFESNLTVLLREHKQHESVSAILNEP